MRRAPAVGALTLLLLVARLSLGSENEALLLRAARAKEAAMDSGTSDDWRTAYAYFFAAHAAAPSADTWYELGDIAQHLGQADVAANHFQDALSLGLEGTAGAKAAEFVRAALLARGQISISGPDGVQVSILGFQRGTLPLAHPLFVNPGITNLRLTFPQTNQVLHLSVQVARGATARVKLDSAMLPASATLRPTSTMPLPQVPGEPSSLATATSRSTNLGLTPPRSLEAGITAAGFGLSISSVLVLTTSYLKLESKREELARLCETPGTSRDGCLNVQPGHYQDGVRVAHDIATWKTIRAIGWLGVGLGAISTTAGWYFWKPRARSETPRPVLLDVTAGARSAILTLESPF